MLYKERFFASRANRFMAYITTFLVIYLLLFDGVAEFFFQEFGTRFNFICAESAGSTEVPVKHYEIPLLVYASAQVRPGTVDTLGSQIDIPPTVLGLLNMSYEPRFLERDLLDRRNHNTPGRSFRPIRSGAPEGRRTGGPQPATTGGDLCVQLA